MIPRRIQLFPMERATIAELTFLSDEGCSINNDFSKSHMRCHQMVGVRSARPSR